MKLAQAPIMWLLALLALALPACGERPSLTELERVLNASWQSYRPQYISPEGRVIIPERQGGTISEGQAYAMLRAVWAGDEPTFARVYAWTQKSLSNPDHLLSWHWGRRPDGSWGVLDGNTASDADLDYALALLLAARRGWPAPPGLPDYAAGAREVMGGILAKEVVALPGGLHILTPGDWHEAGPPYLLNPSYFSPAAYRLFDQISTRSERAAREPPLQNLGNSPLGAGLEPPRQGSGVDRPGEGAGRHSPSPLRGEGREGGEWGRLHQDTYELLARLSQGLGESRGVGLFPDWCRVDAGGRLTPAPGRETHFGWEAVRLPWRLALDGLWYGEPRASQLLSRKFLPFMKWEWQAKARLAAVYNFDGVPLADYESPVLYAGVLATALAASDRDFARQLAEKILGFYHEKDGRAYFVSPDNYYANNWAWLGLALYAGWVKP